MEIPAVVRELAYLRGLARYLIQSERRYREMIAETEAKATIAKSIGDAAGRQHMLGLLEQMREAELEMEFQILEIGQYLPMLCDEIDKLGCRELVFEALNTNKAHRYTEMVEKYGDTTLSMISVLDLENSATETDTIEDRPLKWCVLMAMMNAIKTHAGFDRAVHDITNETFKGAFGEYRPRPLTQRLTEI